MLYCMYRKGENHMTIATIQTQDEIIRIWSEWQLDEACAHFKSTGQAFTLIVCEFHVISDR